MLVAGVRSKHMGVLAVRSFVDADDVVIRSFEIRAEAGDGDGVVAVLCQKRDIAPETDCDDVVVITWKWAALADEPCEESRCSDIERRRISSFNLDGCNSFGRGESHCSYSAVRVGDLNELPGCLGSLTGDVCSVVCQGDNSGRLALLLVNNGETEREVACRHAVRNLQNLHSIDNQRAISLSPVPLDRAGNAGKLRRR